MLELNIVQKIAVWVLPVLFAITVHEVAHGWMARRLGDPTAQMLGRLTLNPIKHIDPFGTILVPLVMLLLPGGFVFGWAKPVPVTWENLHNPKRDMAIVAAAGPGANLLMGILWALVIKLGAVLAAHVSGGMLFLVYMGVAGVFINAILMVLNLVPLPPLDGGRVLVGVLPGPAAWKVSRIEPYGMIIIVVLLVSGILGQILWPFIRLVLVGLAHVAGIEPGLLVAILNHMGA